MYVKAVVPGVTYVCVGVWPVTGDVLSPKSHVYVSAASIARKLTALPEATWVAWKEELSAYFAVKSPLRPTGPEMLISLAFVQLPAVSVTVNVPPPPYVCVRWPSSRSSRRRSSRT